jgi:hypothetical protein
MPRGKKNDALWNDKIKKSAGLPVEPKKKIVRKKKMNDTERALQDTETLGILAKEEQSVLADLQDALKGRNPNTNPMNFLSTVVITAMQVSANGFVNVSGATGGPVVNPVPGQQFIVTTNVTDPSGVLPPRTDVTEYRIPKADLNTAIDELNAELENVQSTILAKKV